MWSRSTSSSRRVTVAESSALPAGYSHRIAATPVDGAYIAVWVQGPDGAQDIHNRVFTR